MRVDRFTFQAGKAAYNVMNRQSVIMESLIQLVMIPFWPVSFLEEEKDGEQGDDTYGSQNPEDVTPPKS